MWPITVRSTVKPVPIVFFFPLPSRSENMFSFPPPPPPPRSPSQEKKEKKLGLINCSSLLRPAEERRQTGPCLIISLLLPRPHPFRPRVFPCILEEEEEEEGPWRFILWRRGILGWIWTMETAMGIRFSQIVFSYICACMVGAWDIERSMHKRGRHARNIFGRGMGIYIWAGG